MATFPYFIIGPNTILSLIGLIAGKAPEAKLPLASVDGVAIDVLVAARNEANTILLCLDSIARQTVQPRRILLVDDASTDETVAHAKAFAKANKLPLEVVSRADHQGKTPGVKAGTRSTDAEVEFVLDADTVLVDDTYIERTVAALRSDPEVASVCGTILPLRDGDRRRFARNDAVARFLKAHPEASVERDRSFLHRFARAITNLYREVLYYFLQTFVYRGQVALYGTILNPVGCAVAYRREDLAEIFDHYEELLGDDLTFSEDIFIGFALLARGRKNLQIVDVVTRSKEPEAQQAPRQIFLWSSAFLQSCFYFPELLFSPFRMLRRLREGKQISDASKGDGAERDVRGIAVLADQERQRSKRYGRPVGWPIFLAALEKVAFPVGLVLMIVFQAWIPLLITVVAETGLQVLIILLAGGPNRLTYALKAPLVAPLRYGSILFDLITIGRFLFDLFRRATGLFPGRGWRK